MRKTFLIPVLMILMIIPSVYAATIVFEDDYNYNNGGTYSDGIVWSGGSMSVSVPDFPAGTQVACWGWNTNGVYTHCYGYAHHLESCMKKSGFLKEICETDIGECIESTVDSPNTMETGSVGDSWYNYVYVKYYRNCDSSFSWGYASNSPALHKIIKSRSYRCVGSADYDDSYYAGKYPFWFDTHSCNSTSYCNQSIPQSQLSFGVNGDSMPSRNPCSPLCGNKVCNSGEEGSCYQDCEPYFSAYNVKPGKEIVYPGETITFKAYFRNYGFQGHADIFGVPVDKNHIQYKLDPETTDTLNKYGTGSVTLSWTVPLTATPGEYNFRVEPQNYCAGTCSQYPDKIEFATLFEIGQPPDIEVNPTALIFNI
ncbi:hypothetical protein GF345_01615 [Candidatus Woesearchaeota archaeon]|nr:hypothetical protein [Candidatus Woesearchaeota archaeon]